MDNTVAADTPAVRLNRSARREAILKGAAKAFVRQGYDATSLEDISEAAGISRALLYRHFDSKEAIYRAILDSTMERIRDGQVVTPGTGFGNKLEQLIEVASVYPDGFVLVFRHAVREPAFKEQAGAELS
jgi:AcrR family transcriptional regulator